MLAALLANAPAIFLTPDAPPGERVVWGACVSAAVVLGGWGLLSRNRPERDTRVGVALLAAMILVAAAALLAVAKNHERQTERNRQEREQRDHEGGGPSEFRSPY